MKVAKVTSKGQVTIPVEIRHQLGIGDNTYLEVSVDGDAVRFRKRRDARPLGDEDPIWDLIGAAASGDREGSTDHDHHLAEGERRRWRSSSLDTSAVYALVDRDDTNHPAASARLPSMKRSRTDATSFAVMERLGLDRALAFDRHFTQYGFRSL